MKLAVFGATGGTGEQLVRQALAALHQAVADTDAVLSALGSRLMNAATTVYSTGTTTILTAMQDAGTRRFVGVSTAPVARNCQDLWLPSTPPTILNARSGDGFDESRE